MYEKHLAKFWCYFSFLTQKESKLNYHELLNHVLKREFLSRCVLFIELHSMLFN